MSSIKIFLKKYSLPILAGFCIGTTYIPFFPWALAFCLVPLWLFWTQNKNSPKTLFIGSWLTQFILNLIGFHWVAHTAIEFGEFPPALGYIILLLFASIAHLYFPIAAIIWSWCQKRVPQWAQLLMIPLIFAVCESFYPTIFFWHLGYPWLWIQLPGVHIAEWIGFYGINLITLFINLAVLIFVLSRKKRILIAALTVFLVVNGLGLYLKSRFKEGDKAIDVLVVQGNIGNSIKLQQDKGPKFHQIITSKFLDMSREAILNDRVLNPDRKIDLMIWPETAYPSLLATPPQPPYNAQRMLRSAVKSLGVPLLTGAYQEELQGRHDVFNSLVLLDSQGEAVKSYHKTLLLAFGEYFPGADIVPQLLEWFPMVSNFGRGSGPTVLPMDPEPRIGAQICYESLFDDFSRSVFDQGAQVIVNVTNDSWFGTDFEPYQHLYMTLARALEFRIPLIRSTNTGISTAISASGEIATMSPLHEEWTGIFHVRYSDKQRPTLYSHFAGYWRWTLLGLCVLILIGGNFVKPRNS
jgi:apolipoprotein N-acyltransferase